MSPADAITIASGEPSHARGFVRFGAAVDWLAERGHTDDDLPAMLAEYVVDWRAPETERDERGNEYVWDDREEYVSDDDSFPASLLLAFAGVIECADDNPPRLVPLGEPLAPEHADAIAGAVFALAPGVDVHADRLAGSPCRVVVSAYAGDRLALLSVAGVDGGGMSFTIHDPDAPPLARPRHLDALTVPHDAPPGAYRAAALAALVYYRDALRRADERRA
jgi:hypothetical protein